jgi:hypothetical protein
MDFSDLVLSGTHRRHGVLILAGPGVDKGKVLENTSILDVTPTILSYLNLAVPEEMDGQFLTASFLQDYVNVYYMSNGIMERVEKSFPDKESEDISERLRQLGYL